MGASAGLFAPRAPQPLTVSQLNQRAKLLLERDIALVAVVGEVSGLKVSSGHRYFALKDAGSQLSAVMFRREAERATDALAEGREVVAWGKLTVYVPYGRYQLVVERVESVGAGALQAAFEKLKAKLAAEGLFAPERKRALPLVPGRVAVVTSPTGAVIRDIVHVASRRWPRAQLLVVPTKVQGAESAESIVAAIVRASALGRDGQCHVLIVARGGGSLEDLWGFNDERVARAIAACPIPVVSAVGHETDFTISDFVADVRAPTPSAAAELVFPVASELRATLHRALERSRRAIVRELEYERARVVAARRVLGDGAWITRERSQTLTHVSMRVARGMQRRLDRERLRLGERSSRLATLHPRLSIARSRARLDAALSRCRAAVLQLLVRERGVLKGLGQRLHALSPLAVLDRGYAIALGPSGNALRDAQAVRVGDTLAVRLAAGSLEAKVVAVHGDPTSDTGTR